MGRPIGKKYFGNTNVPPVGGESLNTIVLSTTSLAVSTLSITVVIGAPNLPGGVQATATAIKTGNTVTSVIVNEAGGGYTSAPSVSFTGTNMDSIGAATATLTSTDQNAITVYAYVPGGSSSVIGDVVKQEASRRYLVKTAQGQGQCILVTTSTITAGQMYMTAEDVSGNTYYVDKLTARRARLTQYTLNTGSFEYANGDTTRWSLSAATTGTVKIVNT